MSTFKPTTKQRELVIEYLVEGNTKEELADQLISRMSGDELAEILDHIDEVAMELELEQVAHNHHE